ncbi:MAG: gamma carbonic anhydrase family protein [Caldimonas sp.]
MIAHHIYSFDGHSPRILPGAYVHPSACLIGDVQIGEGCFVGPQATLRADHGPIRLEAMSNVQDNCVLHASPGGAVVLHRFAQAGHGAVLHGCTLMENCLVGIHATVLDGAVLGPDSLLAAHSLLTTGVRTEAGSLYAGSPAHFMKSQSRDAIAAQREGALRYARAAAEYRRSLRPVADQTANLRAVTWGGPAVASVLDPRPRRAA